MKTFGMFSVIFLILLIPIVLAASTTYSCLDVNTSQEHIYQTIIQDSNTSEIEIIENITCQFGCNSETGVCHPAPYESNVNNIAIMAGSVLGAIFFIYLGTMSSKQHWVMQSFFLFVGLILIINTFAVAEVMATTTQASASLKGLLNKAVMVTSFAFYFAVAYFVFTLIRELLGKMLPWTQGKRGERGRRHEG